VSDAGVLFRRCRLRGVELTVTLFDATRPLVSGNDDTDVIWACPLACGRDFLLRLASRQGKDLLAECRRAAPAGSRLCGRDARTPRWPRRNRRFHCSGRRLGRRRPGSPRAFAVTREYALGRFQLRELASKFLTLLIDAGERLADPLLLLGDLVQCRHS